VIRILERAHRAIVGTYEPGRTFGFVIPDNPSLAHDIYIPRDMTLKAKKGQSVVAEIIRYPSAQRNPEGRIREILGWPDDPDVEIEIVLRKQGIPSRFPGKVTEEARRSAKESISEADLKGRLDLRDKLIITIDGEHAKDFDDAVSIEKTAQGNYRLGVHIADVSHYVERGTALDREAYKRGTSVYFPDRVVPMLPFDLSNNICSLKPDEDRLTLSVFLDFNAHGSVIGKKFHKSVIRSRERMTYGDVSDLIQGKKKDLLKRYKDILSDLKLMEELRIILGKKRGVEGSIDFDFPEAELIMDHQGKLENILRVERNNAHMLIEEFMLAANKAVAERLEKLKVPALYRVHSDPDHDQVSEFSEFVHNFGYKLPSGEIEPVHFKILLDQIKGKPEERLISTIMLRHMKQARYSSENTGHFGLAFKHYTHFTSPIRRYPDLVVHRVLKGSIDSKDKDGQIPKKESIQEIAEHSSVTERRAEKAERDITDLKKVQFMEDKVGEEYRGIISGITSFGIFVELEDIFIEGLIHISNLRDDYYIYDEKNHTLIGEKLKKIFHIGDRLLIEVWGISIEKRQIDFRIIKKG